ncbi:MAG TPA: calcium/sodium antiporter [Rhodothermales bacterium]|nr:calcium/sodium antiporter [Rhodothermales bacterium]HRR08780.1 calcium/sodium antiporter [Rhodothermales bacterium]
MTVFTFLFLIGGLVLLVLGADALVKGASRLALALGISPIIIGLTVVSYGTSAPELAVSTQAAWVGQADLGVGNVVGSNIFNILFILGLSSIIVPLVVHTQLIRIDVPVMISTAILFFLFVLDGQLAKWEAGILALGAILYTWFQIHLSRKEKKSALEQEFEAELSQEPRTGTAINIGWILLGLVMLVLGSNWLVDSAITIARTLGVSELIIGLTIVAIGTSLPEVATSVAAALKGERDIAVGNVVGSNIFNILIVLGIAGLVSPQPINVSNAAIAFDIPVMLAISVACFPIFFKGLEITRFRGALFFFYYIAYTLYLVLAHTKHDALSTFSTAMWYFVLPFTVLTLIWYFIGGIKEWRAEAS